MGATVAVRVALGVGAGAGPAHPVNPIPAPISAATARPFPMTLMWRPYGAGNPGIPVARPAGMPGPEPSDDQSVRAGYSVGVVR